MKSFPAYYVETFFDGFAWHRGGWCFQQNDRGNYKISAEPKAKGCQVLALAPLINMHAHLSHVPRYNNLSGATVLENKPNVGNGSFNERIFYSAQDSALNGVKIVCSSIRPEDVDDLIGIYNDLPIYIIPFLSVKQYHDHELIIQLLKKLEDFFIKSNLLIRPALMIHSLYNITEKEMLLYSQYALEHKIVLSIHFFEWEEEMDFYNNPNGYNEGDIFTRMRVNWPKKTLETYLEKFSKNENLMKVLVHCNYLPHKLANIIHGVNNLVAFCPTSCVRLRNKAAMPERLNKIVFSTDGYFTNMGYNLFTEIKTYNILSQMNDLNYHPDCLLSGITGNSMNYIYRSGLVSDKTLIHNIRNINFFRKKCGFVPSENEGFDLLNYHDSYDRVNIDE
ncbi:hypothetical protein KKI90_11635 [Xenorhabdus bovienii]|uniref:hypothetical protein n=1 Tax=Xenorhabdus bovienii TaxID=40576 RepID=UPI00237CF47E|nr:hypothetical protein [Xenorhabdus bovienii]MDE1487101.1 hypothetical protein [Xenorhabdus bovienii]MDE9477869.1 hypothetical protein [Xenorhabdus bovienii]MDE9530760.1 hypothetical protein [Xenorhabdus bovienii]